MSCPRRCVGTYGLILLVGLLILAHQWDWGFSPDELFLGILPYELLNQVVISIAAAGAWWFATRFAWPQNLEDAVVSEVAVGSASGADPTDEAPATDADV